MVILLMSCGAQNNGKFYAWPRRILTDGRKAKGHTVKTSKDSGSVRWQALQRLTPPSLWFHSLLN